MTAAPSPTPGRLLALVVQALAVVVALGVAVLPLGRLFVASLRVHEVTLDGGITHRVAGYVTRADGLVRYSLAPADDPDGELIPVSVPEARVVAEGDRWSLAHYGDVWRSTRTPGLLRNSFVLAAGTALLALLLGLPIAWVLARAAFRGRRLLTVLLAGPLLLPPFFAAMGVSTSVGHALAALGLAGGTLQLANAIVCLAGLLAPVPALLVGRALAAVPAGLVDAAVLAGGPRAARRGVVWPSVRPAVAASATLVFVVALTDFAVPDLLGVFLPDRATAVHVFATEIFLQWNRYGNVGRAVATGAPFVAIVFALLLVAFATLRRAPGGVLGGATRTRPRVAWTGARAAWPWLVAAPVLGLGLVLPIGSVMAWGFSPAKVVATVRETAGLLEDTERWVRLGLLTAFVATAVAVVLARAALRRGVAWKGVAALAGGLPLAVPGLVLMVGTLLLWLPLREKPNSLAMGTAVLVGRFLPYALVAVGLALREVDPRMEEAARLAGASPATLLARIWGPLSLRGVATAFLLVLVLAFRELDAIQLIAPGIVPVRIYDKVHWGRTADVANLSMAYLGLLLVPALLAACLVPRARDTGGDDPGADETAAPTSVP